MPFTRGPWRNHDFHHAKRPIQPPCSTRWAIEPVDQSKSWVGCSTFASILGWSSRWGLKTSHWLRLEKIWGWNIKKLSMIRAFNPSITEFSALPCLVNMYMYIYIYSIHIYIYGWWYTCPSEKYDFVTWGYEISNMWKVIIHSCSKPPPRIL